MADQRPDPDQLLNRVNAEEARAKRGKLKIFFGASAGVGKTYAMLGAARQQLLAGVDVVIGIVETHGRMETEVMADGLEHLPLRDIPYRDRVLKEFDLDGALARKPALILMDELAHSNVAGSRHAKRWQDIDELLAAGIDVYSTVNVQHLESLNDVVSGITGIRVWETVPDKVFDAADEVVLVNLPPDELLQRLQAGKVYLPQPGGTGDPQLFPQGQPDRPARTGAAPHGRPGRRPDAAIPARPVCLAGLANPRFAARLHRHGCGRGEDRPHHGSCRQPAGSPVARHLHRNPGLAAAVRGESPSHPAQSQAGRGTGCRRRRRCRATMRKRSRSNMPAITISRRFSSDGIIRVRGAPGTALSPTALASERPISMCFR